MGRFFLLQKNLGLLKLPCPSAGWRNALLNRRGTFGADKQISKKGLFQYLFFPFSRSYGEAVEATEQTVRWGVDIDKNAIAAY